MTARQIHVQAVPEKARLSSERAAFGWNMETEDTPAIRAALDDLDTPSWCAASTMGLGFRKGDPILPMDARPARCFWAISFTDGLWVNDIDTFVNLYRPPRPRTGRRGAVSGECRRQWIRSLRRGVRPRALLRRGRSPATGVRHVLPERRGRGLRCVMKATLVDRDRRWQASLDQLARIIGLSPRAEPGSCWWRFLQGTSL